MGNRLNVSHGAPQNQASFIVDRGWKSSNSSPLPVEGEVFFLTFPFIDQAFALRTRLLVKWRFIANHWPTLSGGVWIIVRVRLRRLSIYFPQQVYRAHNCCKDSYHKT